MKNKKLTKQEITTAKIKAIMANIEGIFKSKKVKDNQPKIIFIDKGGKYLEDPQKGDRLSTFITISWVANNQIKDYVLRFDDHEVALKLALEFKNKYINTRLGEAIK